MSGTTLVRDAPAPSRSGPSPPASPSVLIRVPTLPGTRPHHRPRRRVRAGSTAERPRRRLRREVRLLGLAALVGGGVVAGVLIGGRLGSRSGRSGTLGAPEPASTTSQSVADPFDIELRQPIPVPPDQIEEADRPAPPPVAWPGYLLPDDGNQEDLGIE